MRISDCLVLLESLLIVNWGLLKLLDLLALDFRQVFSFLAFLTL